MSLSSKVDRRKFFTAAIAFVAAILTPKPKLAAKPMELVSKGWSEPLPARIEQYSFYELWPGPNAPVFPAYLNFHKDAFALESPRLTPAEVDIAFDEVNRMMDRWSRESLFPAVRVQDFAP